MGANHIANTHTDRTYNSENYIKECKLGETKAPAQFKFGNSQKEHKVSLRY